MESSRARYEKQIYISHTTGWVDNLPWPGAEHQYRWHALYSPIIVDEFAFAAVFAHLQLLRAIDRKRCQTKSFHVWFCLERSVLVALSPLFYFIAWSAPSTARAPFRRQREREKNAEHNQPPLPHLNALT
jgi:hypothetical protein